MIKHRAMTAILGALLAGCSVACGSSPAKAVVASPTPDSTTRTYVALANNYWRQFKAAQGDALAVCFGTSQNDVQYVNPSNCRERSIAMIAVNEKFLSDLDTTPPPPQFARDDRAFRSQLPKAIADLKAMISASATGSKVAVLDATFVFVKDMIPVVTDALDDVDPAVTHT